MVQRETQSSGRGVSGFWQRASRFQQASPRKPAPFIVGPFPGRRNSLRRQMACRADDAGHLGVIAATAWQKATFGRCTVRKRPCRYK